MWSWLRTTCMKVIDANTFQHWGHCLCLWSRYRIKESSGWQQVFSSPYLDWTIERIALNAKVVGGPHGDKDKMVAAASESSIILWSIQDGGSGNEIGKQGDTACLCCVHSPKFTLTPTCPHHPRCIQSWCTCGWSLFHWEPAGGYKSYWEGRSVECRHTALAGRRVCVCVCDSPQCLCCLYCPCPLESLFSLYTLSYCRNMAATV